MPSKRNKPEAYDAKINKPAPKKQGILKVGALAPIERDTSVAEVGASSDARFLTGWLLSILVAVVGGVFAFRIRLGNGV